MTSSSQGMKPPQQTLATRAPAEIVLASEHKPEAFVEHPLIPGGLGSLQGYAAAGPDSLDDTVCLPPPSAAQSPDESMGIVCEPMS